MKKMLVVLIVGMAITFTLMKAQEGEFKDTPYFSAMPNYRIVDASDKEFDNYRFYNSKDCNTLEGKKFSRSYTLKENVKQSSELQIFLGTMQMPLKPWAGQLSLKAYVKVQIALRIVVIK